MTLETVPLSSISPDPANTRKHSRRNLDAIKASLRRFGQQKPIVVDVKGVVLAGNGTLAAATELGWPEIQIVRTELAGVDATAFGIADNRTAELAEWDANLGDVLASLKAEDFPLAEIGFDEDDLAELAGEPEPSDADAEPQIDKAEELRAKWGVELGQVWQLGEHRIACGDSTDAKVWDGLLGIERAQLTHTDPPYGVAYKDSKGVGIQNDSLQGNALSDLVHSALSRCIERSNDDAAFYIWHATSTRRDFERALDTLGLQERQYLTWVKDSFTLGRSDYHWQTEPCFYAEKCGHRAKWFGDRAQATVWRVGSIKPSKSTYTIANGILISNGANAELFIKGKKPKSAGKIRHVRLDKGDSIALTADAVTNAWQIERDSKADYYHPTQKPVAIPAMAIENSSTRGDIVLEPFSGSGSTLLACETLGRRCRACDIEPKFVAVALERWADATGKEPHKL